MGARSPNVSLYAMRLRLSFFSIFIVSCLSAPAIFSQALSNEQYYLSNGIGYNKYLKSTTPNAAGEYTLRLETFVTGHVEEVPVPTDFVLVIDGSGSMQYDIRVSGHSTSPNSISGADIQKFKIDQRIADAFDGLRYYSYDGIYRAVTSNWNQSTKKWGNGDGYNFPSPFADNAESSRYYYSNADQTYYRIRRGTGTKNGTTYYYLYFVRDRISNPKTYYLYTEQDGRMYYTDKLNDNITNVTSAKQIIVAPNLNPTISYNSANDDNAWCRHLFRPQQRREALIEALDGFFDDLAQKNNGKQSSEQHKVAMVSFTGRYNNTTNKDDITASNGQSYGYFQASKYNNTATPSGYTPATNDQINAAPENSTRVIQAFASVTTTNAGTFKNRAKRSIRFSGGANNHPNQGMRLARLLLENLQTQTNMGPLTAQGGLNRNKIVILFTDEITKGFGSADVSPDNGLSGISGGTYATFYEAKLIKAVRSTLSGTQINGKVFTIDYSTPGTTDVEKFLSYLSSNYQNGDYTQKTGAIDNTKYTGTQITPAASRIYYYNGVTTPLTTVFSNILTKSDFGTVPSATQGDQVNNPLVMMDRLSGSFVIPSDLTGKVKYYTAQCIGTKTITGGANNPYLAFASEVQAPDRASLAHLWVSSFDSGNLLVWEDKGPIDIDNNLSYTVSSDRKTFTVKGFNFGDLWCGHDPKHDNTRTLNSSDPNYSYRQDGYRGFKLIVEFPIILSEAAVGGTDILTNDTSASGVYRADGSGNPTGNPIVTYPAPVLTFPVTLWIRKTGLRPGESASFTIQRKPRSSGSWQDFTSFILTGEEQNNPEIKLLNMDPAYHYRIKETGWSWSYDSAAKTTFPSTENVSLLNPIVISNSFQSISVERGESKETNLLGVE